MNWDEFEKWCAALCCWREARGDVAAAGNDALRGVIHVIANRAIVRKKSWAQIVFQYEQFSSITAPNDPQIRAGVMPVSPDPIFDNCYAIADAVFAGIDPDPTGGATFYFADTIAMPSWAATMTATARIGHHLFYREV